MFTYLFASSPRTFSGIQPTGTLHLGNYLGQRDWQIQASLFSCRLINHFKAFWDNQRCGWLYQNPNPTFWLCWLKKQILVFLFYLRKHFQALVDASNPPDRTSVSLKLLISPIFFFLGGHFRLIWPGKHPRTEHGIIYDRLFDNFDSFLWEKSGWSPKPRATYMCFWSGSGLDPGRPPKK